VKNLRRTVQEDPALLCAIARSKTRPPLCPWEKQIRLPLHPWDEAQIRPLSTRARMCPGAREPNLPRHRR